MAGRQIDFNINASDNGTLDKLSRKAKAANQEFEKLKNTASGVGTGTKSGDQAMRRATAAPAANSELDEYTGGVGRRRGASARDFAAEAQGLGGLVRLYAEYAANIYAVTAAFGALQNAMQTEIMIRGMQQLGAQAGTSLVGMTKQFVAATDGMVSFREAAEAVTKVTTSGMGKQQVMDIATVAKGASQALGLSMTDAVSRLSRGITKLEPELLDELGLFTKLDKAVTDYARSVGKTEGQLTDFERRQSFANAVLEEGKKKFGEIAQAGNPYDQLLANLKNVATDILNIVNTVVAPIAKILADNTGLLTAAIGLFALKIVSKVFPVLGDYRDKLDRLAKESKDKATQIAEAAKEREVFGKTGLEAKAGVPQAKAALDIAKAKEALAKEELGLANKQNMSLAERAVAEQKINNLVKQRIAAETNFKKAGDLAAELGTKPSTFSPTSYIQQQNAQAAASGAARTGIVADVSRQFEIKGIRESFASLTTQISENSNVLGKWGKITTFAAGSAAILGQGISLIGGFIFNRLLGPLSIAISLYEVLNALFNTNAKEMKKLEDGLSQLEDVTKTAIDTNEKYKGSIGVDAVIAYANSIKVLNENIQSVVKSFNDTKKASSGFDNAFNFLADITPGLDSIEEKTSRGLGAALAAGIDNIKSAPLKAELTKKYREILNIDEKTPLTPKTIEAALNKLDGFGAAAAKRYKDAVEALGLASESANKTIQDQSLYLRGLVESGDLATKSIQNFMNSLKDSSPLSQMLQNNIKYLSQLNKALSVDDINAQAAALDALSKVDFAVFGEAAIEIAKMSDEFQNQKVDIDALNAAHQEQIEKLKELKAGRKNGPFAFGPETNAGRKERMDEIARVEEVISIQEKVINNFKDKFAIVANTVALATSAAVKKNAETAVDAVKLELDKIKIDYQKSLIGILPVKTERSIKLQADLDRKSIDIETQLIKSQMNLANSTDKLRLSIELMRDDQKIQELAAKETKQGFLSTADISMLSRLVTRRSNSERALEALDKGTIKQIQDLLGDFPELFDAMMRRLRMTQVDAKAASDKRKVGNKELVDTIKVRGEQTRAELEFEQQKASQIISQIGSDTPGKLQAQIDLANRSLSRQLQIIKSSAKEKLDAIDVAQKGGTDKETADELRTKVNLEAQRLETLAKSKTEYENINMVANLTALTTKQTNELLIKRIEIQKQLVRGESLEAFDRLAEMNRQIVAAQQAIESADLERTAAISKANVNKFLKENARPGIDGDPTTLMTEELKEQLKLLQVVADEDQARVHALKALHMLQTGTNKTLTDQDRIVKQLTINEEKRKAAADEILRIETAKIRTVEHELKLEEIRLSIEEQKGNIGGDNLAKAQMAIRLQQIDNNLKADELNIQEQLLQARAALEKEEAVSGSRIVGDPYGGAFRINETAARIELEAKVRSLEEQLKAAGIAARRSKEQTKAAFVPQEVLQARAIAETKTQAAEDLQIRNAQKLTTEKEHQIKLDETRLDIQARLGNIVGDELALAKQKLDILRIENNLQQDQSVAAAEIARAERELARLRGLAGTRTETRPGATPGSYGGTITIQNTNEEIEKQVKLLEELRARYSNLAPVAQRLIEILVNGFVSINKLQERELGQTRELIKADNLVIAKQRETRELEHQLELEEISLNIQGRLGSLTGDDLAKRQLSIQKRRIDVQLERDLVQAKRDELAAQQRLDNAKRAAGVDPVTKAQNISPAVLEAQQNLAVATQRTEDLGRAATEAKERIDAAFVPDEVQRFSDFWVSSFDKMGTSLLEFIKTGKGSFKDFMASILEDYARMLVQMAMKRAAAATLNAAISILTGGRGAPIVPGSAPIPGQNPGGDIIFTATGAAFSLEGYARGGSFTNKVVDTPTVFKFGRGGMPNRLGVMGEAGPEAIMPLKRMSSGNLGVEGGGGTVVDIKINNYTGQQASKKETTDSRGNRNIEITIGDMISGEVARNNSSMQNSIGNTFGMKPQLIKR